MDYESRDETKKLTGDESPDGIITTEAFERLGKVRDAVMQGRVFSDDSADLIEQGRAERSAELEQISSDEQDSST